MSKDTYEIDICGRKERLPKIALPSGITIAFFNLHGNVSLTEYCAEKLKERLEKFDFDVILTAESKGLQLTHALALRLGHDFYAVARKSKKLYMTDGISAEVKSITTGNVQSLYLSAHDAALLCGKRVAIVDDVISTGGSMCGLEELVQKSGGTVAVKAAVLAEGDTPVKDAATLANLPVWYN